MKQNNITTAWNKLIEMHPELQQPKEVVDT
jgi:hypothetical protein